LPQFLFPKFSRGIIKMKTGNVLSANLNYNTADEEMLFEQKGVYMVVEKPQDIDTVFLQNRRFVLVEKGFYEVLVNDASSFYIQHKSRYTSVGTPTAYGMTSQVNASTKINTFQSGNQVRSIEFPENVAVSSADVYWVRRNGAFKKFSNERQLYKIFPEKETQLKEYIKKEKLDLKVRDDLIKLGIYCNELLK
jgi:hypothetical protein